MKKIALIITLLAASLVATAQRSSFSGTIVGIEKGTRVVVSEPRGGRLVPVDTLTPDSKGRIKKDFQSADPVFVAFALTRTQSPMVHVIMLPGEKISMDMVFMPAINFINITSAKGSSNADVYMRYTNLMSDALVDQRLQQTLALKMEQLLSTNANVLMSAFLVTYFESAFEQYAGLYKAIRDSLIGTYPENDFVRHLDSKLRASIVAGMDAPDIALPDRDGQIRRLSDLRGKVVLIDFWASWCRPCRMENPNVVNVYKRYKDKGFEIFSVSLDNNREAWLKAIEVDGLVWPNHVSDLRGWSSAGGRLYGISSIPATVLVGPDGKVLARNLRGAELERKLAEIFAQ